MAERTFQCTAVTPEGSVLETEATSAIFPAYDGELGVLPNHAPLLTKLGIGVLQVITAEGERREIYIDGGFVQMVDNKLTLLTEKAKPVEELTGAEAEKAMETARGFGVAVTDDEVEARDKAYQRARVKKRLAAS